MGKDRKKQEAGAPARESAGVPKNEARARKLAARAARTEAKARKLAKKQARANKGYVKTGPLLGVVLLAGGLAVFGVFFMNPLLESAAEAALEAVFGAKAEVDGLRFRPFRMSLEMAAVSVADAKAPMTDLFRTGRVALRLNPAAALRGKIYIEEAGAASIALGTPRDSSGALPGTEEPEPKPRKETPEPPALVDLENFDASDLLEREKSKLASPAAYEAAGAAYREAAARWSVRVQSSGAALEKAEASSKGALAMDVKSIKTAEQAAKALAEVQAAIRDVKTAGSEVSEVSEGIRRDSATVSRLVKDARAAADRDAAYLKSLANPGTGAAADALEPAVRQLLTNKGEAWLYYGRRILEAASKLKAPPGKKAGGKTKPRAFRGRDVVFPGAGYPVFRLGLLTSDFEAGGNRWTVELREVSSQPDLVPSPCSLLVEAAGGSGARIRADARADLRSGTGNPYTLRAEASALPLDLGSSLAGIGLEGFTGILEGNAEAEGAEGGSFRARLEGTIRKPAVASPSGTFGRAAAGALRSAGAVEARAEYRIEPGAGDSFRLRTNLDEAVGAAVKAAARRYAAKASAEAETALRKYVAEELEGKLDSGEFDGLAKSAQGDAASLSSLEKSLEGKKKELEEKSKALGAGLLKGVSIPKLSP